MRSLNNAVKSTQDKNILLKSSLLWTIVRARLVRCCYTTGACINLISFTSDIYIFCLKMLVVNYHEGNEPEEDWDKGSVFQMFTFCCFLISYYLYVYLAYEIYRYTDNLCELGHTMLTGGGRIGIRVLHPGKEYRKKEGKFCYTVGNVSPVFE